MPARPKITVRGNLLTIQVRLGQPRDSRHSRRKLVASTKGFQFVGRRLGQELGVEVNVAQR